MKLMYFSDMLDECAVKHGNDDLVALSGALLSFLVQQDSHQEVPEPDHVFTVPEIVKLLGVGE